MGCRREVWGAGSRGLRCRSLGCSSRNLGWRSSRLLLADLPVLHHHVFLKHALALASCGAGMDPGVSKLRSESLQCEWPCCAPGGPGDIPEASLTCLLWEGCPKCPHPSAHEPLGSESPTIPLGRASPVPPWSRPPASPVFRPPVPQCLQAYIPGPQTPQWEEGKGS